MLPRSGLWRSLLTLLALVGVGAAAATEPEPRPASERGIIIEWECIGFLHDWDHTPEAEALRDTWKQIDALKESVRKAKAAAAERPDGAAGDGDRSKDAEELARGIAEREREVEAITRNAGAEFPQGIHLWVRLELGREAAWLHTAPWGQVPRRPLSRQIRFPTRDFVYAHEHNDRAARHSLLPDDHERPRTQPGERLAHWPLPLRLLVLPGLQPIAQDDAAIQAVMVLGHLQRTWELRPPGDFMAVGLLQAPLEQAPAHATADAFCGLLADWVRRSHEAQSYPPLRLPWRLEIARTESLTESLRILRFEADVPISSDRQGITDPPDPETFVSALAHLADHLRQAGRSPEGLRESTSDPLRLVPELEAAALTSLLGMEPAAFRLAHHRIFEALEAEERARPLRQALVATRQAIPGAADEAQRLRLRDRAAAIERELAKLLPAAEESWREQVRTLRPRIEEILRSPER